MSQFSANKSELEIRIDDGEYHNELSKAAKALNIFNGTFKINNKGKLEIGNKTIDNGKYCIDYVIDFCNQTKLLEIETKVSF